MSTTDGDIEAAVAREPSAWPPALRSAVESLWSYLVLRDLDGSWEVAIGLGSHDLSVADRAAELVRAGVVPLVVFSGANSKDTARTLPDGEAVHLARRAVELGADAASILVETTATNTAENLVASVALLGAAGVHPERVLLITRPYHQRRALATGARCWPQIRWGSTAIDLSLTAYLERVGDPRRVVETMVGEVERLEVYRAHGTILAPPVPGTVSAAAQWLVRHGFDGRLTGAGVRA